MKNIKEIARQTVTEFNPELADAARLTLQADLFKQAVPLNWDTVSGVYFLFDGDEIVYVGQSKNVHARIATHMSEGLKVFTHWAFIQLPDGERLEAERYLIELFKPKYHRVLLADLGFVSRQSLEAEFGLPMWAADKIVTAHNVPCAPGNMIHAEKFAEAIGKPLPVKVVDISPQEKLF